MTAPPSFPTPREHIRQLKRYMKDNGISYGELGRAMGHTDKSQVSRWMSERVEPRISTLQKIERAIKKIMRGR